MPMKKNSGFIVWIILLSLLALLGLALTVYGSMTWEGTSFLHAIPQEGLINVRNFFSASS